MYKKQNIYLVMKIKVSQQAKALTFVLCMFYQFKKRNID